MATPYMNLTLPVVGPMGTTGPDWANLVNAALTYIDAHDHSSGNGKQITPAGININQTLQMNSQQLSEIASLALDNLGAQPTSSNLIYEYAGELYFNDSSGNKVQLTSGGTINVASLGTITGDYSTSTADLTYSDASKTFIFKQNATTTANVDLGPIKIYRNILSSPYARIQQSNSQAGNLDWTLPASYPASKLPMKVDNSGVQTIEQIVTADIADSQVTSIKLASNSVTFEKVDSSVAGNGLTGGGGVALAVNPDNSTLEVASDQVRIKASGITNSHIAQAAAISRTKLGIYDLYASSAVSTSTVIYNYYTTVASGSFTKPNTAGNVLKFCFIPTNAADPAYLEMLNCSMDVKINIFGIGDLTNRCGSSNSGTTFTPASALTADISLLVNGAATVLWTISAKLNYHGLSNSQGWFRNVSVAIYVV